MCKKNSFENVLRAKTITAIQTAVKSGTPLLLRNDKQQGIDYIYISCRIEINGNKLVKEEGPFYTNRAALIRFCDLYILEENDFLTWFGVTPSIYGYSYQPEKE